MNKVNDTVSDNETGLQDLGFMLAALFWTLTIGAMAGWHHYSDYQATMENARTAARQSVSNDLTVRRWASEHGGIYVPISPTTPPSPYLADIPERDITTPSGRHLTLLNPAYITRQLYDIARTTDTQGYGRITSLNPIRPENFPDNWENKALLALTAGQPEFSGLEQIEGATYLRLMQPMLVESPCLKCHTDQPLALLRGGISISIPWAPYLAGFHQNLPGRNWGHGGVWLLGILGLIFARQRLYGYLLQRWQVEQSLRQSEEKYRLLTEGTEAIPWEFDILADRWSYIAPQVAKALGYQPEEWTDLQFWVDHIHPEDRQRATEYCQLCTGQGQDHQFEYRFLKKDGGVARLKDLVSVEMEEGRPVRLRGVMLDITEHRSMEEKLRQAAKMEAVGTLAAGVAHDFNNILTSLISFATLVKRRHQDDPVSQDYLQEILDSSKRAAELTRSLLAYSRKLEIRANAEDLNDIVDRSSKMLRRLIRENIEIRTELVEGELPVEADRAQIEQVLMNLAGNAQDAMPDGGILTVGTGLIEAGGSDAKTVSGSIPLPCAVLTVADNGTGISPEQLERIFDPFFTTKEVGRGTGLGLAQVYGITQQHHGVVEVDSRPGEGSVFSIFLPLRTPDSPAAEDPEEREAAEPLATDPITILLVEDEPQVRKVLQRLLENQGHRILEADDGEEALRLLREHRDTIDLVVMDVIMPGMNGRETYKQMQVIRADIKALFISGYPGDVITIQNIREEKLNLLAKPLVPNELIRKIKEIIDNQP